MSATPYPQGPLPPQYVIPPRKRTGLATTSLVLGLISILTACICVGVPMGLVALILGIIATSNAYSRPEQYGGAGRAITGIVTGSLSSIFLFIAIAVVWVTGTAAAILASPLFQNNPIVQAITQGIGAVENMERIAKAMAAYQSTYGVAVPSLEALKASGLIPSGVFGQDPNADPTAGAVWVADVSKSDPANWIAAYARINYIDRPQYLVLSISGEVEHFGSEAFDQRLEQFKNAYQSARGHPPTFLGTLPEVDANDNGP